MIWLLGAFVASWVACWCVGFIMRGWLETERQRVRRIPEHPVMRPPTQRRWRVIEGGLQRPNRLYDWQREERGG